MNQVVYSGKQENYANHNADLILWIYEKYEYREALVRYCMVERLIPEEAEGKKAIRATCDWTIDLIFECVCPPTIILSIGQYIFSTSNCAFPYT